MWILKIPNLFFYQKNLRDLWKNKRDQKRSSTCEALHSITTKSNNALQFLNIKCLLHREIYLNFANQVNDFIANDFSLYSSAALLVHPQISMFYIIFLVSLKWINSLQKHKNGKLFLFQEFTKNFASYFVCTKKRRKKG